MNVSFSPCLVQEDSYVPRPGCRACSDPARADGLPAVGGQAVNWQR